MPQPPQKRAPTGFSMPHWGQCMVGLASIGRSSFGAYAGQRLVWSYQVTVTATGVSSTGEGSLRVLYPAAEGGAPSRDSGQALRQAPSASSGRVRPSLIEESCHNLCALERIPIPAFPGRLWKGPESFSHRPRRNHARVSIKGEGTFRFCSQFRIALKVSQVRFGFRVSRQGWESYHPRRAAVD